MSVVKCGTCDHWDHGVCRRYPPVPVEMETIRESSVSGGLVRERQVVNWWPDVDEEEWCGEWKSE